MKLILSLTFTVLFLLSHTQNYNKLWKAVEQHELKGNIKKAQKLVEKIYKLSSKKEHPDQLVKSFIYKAKFNQITLPDNQSNFITLIENEIKKNTFPVNAILEHIYAHFLEDTYNKNSYKISKRTVYQEDQPFELWTTKDFRKAILEHYQASITESTKLQQTALKNYLNILKGSPNALKYRSTLYEYLVYDVVKYLNHLQRFDSHIIEKYTIENLLSSSEKFINLKFESDSIYHTDIKLKLLQDIERFHLSNHNHQQLMDAVRQRFKMLETNYADLNHQSKFLKHLKNIIVTNKNENGIEILEIYLATKYFDFSNRDDDKNLREEAIKICNHIIKNHPKSEASISAQLLKKNILNQLLKFEIEAIESPEKPSLARIEYTNVDTLFLKIFKIPHHIFEDANNHLEEDSILNYIVKKKNQ